MALPAPTTLTITKYWHEGIQVTIDDVPTAQRWDVWIDGKLFKQFPLGCFTRDTDGGIAKMLVSGTPIKPSFTVKVQYVQDGQISPSSPEETITPRSIGTITDPANSAEATAGYFEA